MQCATTYLQADLPPSSTVASTCSSSAFPTDAAIRAKAKKQHSTTSSTPAAVPPRVRQDDHHDDCGTDLSSIVELTVAEEAVSPFLHFLSSARQGRYLALPAPLSSTPRPTDKDLELEQQARQGRYLALPAPNQSTHPGKDLSLRGVTTLDHDSVPAFLHAEHFMLPHLQLTSLAYWIERLCKHMCPGRRVTEDMEKTVYVLNNVTTVDMVASAVFDDHMEEMHTAAVSEFIGLATHPWRPHHPDATIQ
eukprot:712137-Amphidinium_carterae.1